VLKRSLKPLLWVLLFGLIFGAGWFRGYRPDFNLRAYLPSKDPFIILVADRTWLPQEFLDRLSQELDIEIQLEEAPEFADLEARLISQDAPGLLWMPVSWAQALAEQRLISEIMSDRPLISKSVSPDFLITKSGEHLSFIPMIWSAQGNQLRVEGLALAHGGRDRAIALRVMRRWLKADLAELQVRLVDGASALKSLDGADLPYQKRARSLRDLNFKSLKK
jgi:hypothetical protein